MLQNQIITEENEHGLIPVSLEKFVENGEVITAKLWPILNNVQRAWKKRIDIETKREASGDWRSLLGKRISWPMSELDQNLAGVTQDKFIKTERDNLREENAMLRSKINSIVGLVLKLVLNEDTIMS